MSGADVSVSSSMICAGIPRRSKRVLAHVYGAEELCEFAENLVHGKGGKRLPSTLAVEGLFCYNIAMASNSSVQPKSAPTNPDPEDTHVLLPAIARLGVSVGVFGGTFFVIAVIVTMLFSPDRFPVRVGDKTVRLHELEAEEKSLIVKKADLMEERKKILADSDAPVLHQVEKLRALTSPVGSALLSIEDVRHSFRIGSTDPISLPGISFSSEANAITLVGDVRDPSGRSMQILASFVDELRAIESFASVSEPEYKAEPLKDGGTLSHFSLTLRFPHE